MEKKHLSPEISKATYHTIFNNSQYPCFLWKTRGEDLVLIDYNKKGKEITQGAIKDILGVKVSEFYSDRPEIIKDLNRCISDKISFSKEIRYEYKTIDKNSFLKVFYDYIPPDMVLISTQDITQRRKMEKALRKAEEDKSLIFNSISEHIVFQSLNHEVIWANKSAADSVESNAEELTGKKCFKIWNNRTQPCEGCPVEKAIITGRVEENQIKDPSGQYWDIKGFPVKSDNGQIIGVVEVTKNITDRVKAEEALKESEEKYKTVFQNTGNATAILEKDTTISIVNDRFEELVGYRKEEMEGKMSWKELILEVNDLEKMETYHYKRREDPTSVPRTYETKIVDKDGEVHDVLLNVDMIPGTDQSVASLTDITYQKRIQKELKESEDKFKLIAEQSLMGIGILQDDVFKYVNQQFVEKAGYSKEEIKNWKPGEFLKLIHPDYRDIVKQQARKKQEGEKDFETHYEFKAVRKNGEIYWEEIYSKPIKYQGKYADLVTTIEITERKKAEKELKKSQEQYYNAYNRAEFYKDLFAHDINNILQNVRSANELLKIYNKEKEKRPKFEEMIDVIESQVLRGANLISNVRKLSLIDNKNIDLKPKSIKIVLRDVIAEIKQKYSPNRLQIYVQKPEGELLINGNELLYDVFKNILLNAIKYNDNKKVKVNIIISEIEINERIYYKLEFKDNGRGIRDERKESIFQRDYSENEKGKGIGLGLSLVKRILDTYQGTIEVENRVKNDFKKGSNFIIKIPKLNDPL
jgi:PAS domain S-box-containing protein